MPRILDYAGTQTPRRKRMHGDWLFAILAFLQAFLWLSFAMQISDRSVPGSFQFSLFAFAWYIGQQSQVYSLISAAMTAIVAIAALLPADRRYWAYLAYTISAPALLLLSLMGAWYLKTVLTGNWLSMLNDTSGATPSDRFELFQFCSPVFWILILRALIPGERFVGR